MSKLSENLRFIRIIRGKSIRQVAQSLALSPSTLLNWESDRVAPNTAMFEELCKIYDVTPNEMLGWDPCPEIEAFLADKKEKLEAVESLLEQKTQLEAKIREYMKDISLAKDVDVDLAIKNSQTGEIQHLEFMKAPINKS